MTNRCDACGGRIMIGDNYYPILGENKVWKECNLCSSSVDSEKHLNYLKVLRKDSAVYQKEIRDALDYAIRELQ